MKKLLSVLLAMVMLFSIFQITITSFAAEDEKLPIIFVTGIGQTFSHVKTDNAEEGYLYPYKASPDGEIEFVPCAGSKSKGSNIFITDITGSLINIAKSPIKLIKSLRGIAQLLSDLLTGSDMLDKENVATIVKEVFYLMSVDENGDLPEEVFVPFYDYPVEYYLDAEDYAAFPKGPKYAQYPKERFNSMIGFSDEIEKYGEDKVFCFNYAPYGSIENLTDKLDAYIDNVQEKYFPDQKVILVPMSMGATLVSNYLYKFGNKEDVAKVISVVGCWQGSDLFADLIEGKFAENSAEIFYEEMLYELLKGIGDESLANLVRTLVMFLPQKSLTTAGKAIVQVLVDELILKTPTLLGLIPPERYDAIREKYLTRTGYELSLKEADEYHKAQVAVKDTLKNLNEEQGVEFYFIAGYDLGFGDINHPYFKCLASAPTTNSDEVIQIASTTVGATSVAHGTQFSEEYINKAKENGTDKYITPDKSVDVSTAVFPDRVFLFKGQRHELENNTVAIELAVKMALFNENNEQGEQFEYPLVSTHVVNKEKYYDESNEFLLKVTEKLFDIVYSFRIAK